MKILATLAAVAALSAASPVTAQNYGVQPTGAVLPPYEVLTIIRSMGFNPANPPALRGPVYVVRAFDDDDSPVRIVVDARSGHVIGVRESGPNPGYAAAAPGRLGAFPAPRETVPPGMVPPAAVSAGSMYETQPYLAPPPPKHPKIAARTPTPRPRPAQATDERAAVPPAVPSTTASAPEIAATPGKSVPAPVAATAAAPTISPTPLVPVAPLE
jgi:hypothetical protein